MSKKELSLLYAPSLTPESAKNRLCRWLHYNSALMHELVTTTDYREQQRLLTSRQVQIIVKHLGEP